MSFRDYVKVDEKFLVQRNCVVQEKLPPGHYEVHYIQQMDQLIFEKIKFNHDELLELPSKEFQDVASQIDYFLTPESKENFKKYGFLYKRSILMFGEPGTGKTSLVNRIANKVVKEGGIVLFNPDPRLLSMSYKALGDIQPETNLVVVFEELDQLVRTHESTLLNVLDGEVQRDNVIYLATTNYIDKVPPRIMRPGRFSSVIEIKYPNAEARAFYLNRKLGENANKKEIEHWVKNTKGLSIDELKEVVLSTKCLNISFEEVLKRIKSTKQLTNQEQPSIFNIDEDDYNEWKYECVDVNPKEKITVSALVQAMEKYGDKHGQG